MDIDKNRTRNFMIQKNVLITGGAHRLGAALVQAFSAASWRVFLHYGKSEVAAKALAKELQTQGASVQCVQANLELARSRKAMMNEIYRQVDYLDCLINNAAQFEADAADSFNPDNALRQWAINLMAPLDLTQLLAQNNVAAKKSAGRTSCVIHVLDQKVFNLNPDYFSYTVSKLALERSVSVQAQALAPQVRVCGIAPGLMYPSGPQSQENFDLASRMNLLQTPINPNDVASTCLFLANNSAITGDTYCVDNGQHLQASSRDVMFVADDQLKSKK